MRCDWEITQPAAAEQFLCTPEHMLSWASKGDEAWLTILKSIGWGEVLTKQLLYALIKNVFRQLRAEWASGGAGLSPLLWRHQIFSRLALPQHTLSRSVQPLICLHPISHRPSPLVWELMEDPVLSTFPDMASLPHSLSSLIYFPTNPYFLASFENKFTPWVENIKKKMGEGGSQHRNHCRISFMINSFLVVLSFTIFSGLECSWEGSHCLLHFFFRFNTGNYSTHPVAEDEAEIKKTMFYSVNLCLLKISGYSTNSLTRKWM